MFDVLVAALPRYVLAASGFRPGGTHYSPEGALVNRATLTNFVSTHATVYFHGSAATNFNQRFYRAVVRRV